MYNHPLQKNLSLINSFEVWTNQSDSSLNHAFTCYGATPLTPILIGLEENDNGRRLTLGDALHFHDSGNERWGREEHVNCAPAFSFSHFLEHFSLN